ncbi:hypothetical protein P378_00290 [Desulforamulus profundi]|uniref:Uncharacterized protein n=1 Tax=Desulforamulus profundi TaxID=1383067 RepID=A0A2C6MJG7_9FIRM|nr:hypothetical protein P378_00290 [Desulforamulus profundi]
MNKMRNVNNILKQQGTVPKRVWGDDRAHISIFPLFFVCIGLFLFVLILEIII